MTLCWQFADRRTAEGEKAGTQSELRFLLFFPGIRGTMSGKEAGAAACTVGSAEITTREEFAASSSSSSGGCEQARRTSDERVVEGVVGSLRWKREVGARPGTPDWHMPAFILTQYFTSAPPSLSLAPFLSLSAAVAISDPAIIALSKQ